MPDDYYFDPRVAVSYDSDILEARDVVHDDIAFYVELAREAAAQGHAVLELGCGTGRVTIPIAQAGVHVTGLDYSPAMLAVAESKAAAAAVHGVRWVEADMASFELPERFGLVVIPFRSILMLLTPEAQASCLRRIRDHLVPGGRLALNIFNPEVFLPVQEQKEAGGARFTRLKRNLRVRHVTHAEMGELLRNAGFEVEAVWGWFDGRPFDSASSEMVWLAHRI